MQTLMPQVDTDTKEFSDGNPLTGVKGTVVPALWMNNAQGAIRNIQSEMLSVLTAAALNPDGDSTTQLLDAINRLISAAVVTSVYPVGAVKFFASNVNPNDLFPGTTWTYIGQDRVIRLAASDGSDVLGTGGTDSVTLAIQNLPAHGHEYSGTTGAHDFAELTTSSNGKHKHQAGFEAPGDSYAQFITGTDNDGHYTLNFSSEDGDHVHTMDIPSHDHSYSGTTKNTGSGEAVDIRNKFVKLMGWYRSV
ncbi:hypothetical protein ACCY16_02210 [Candidatus Pantoea formicae]|uniref:phage baseplate protein n=1 Tax=Candidatus Pantoea formicae TaxID=2608355 RepID=UPI003ED96C7D